MVIDKLRASRHTKATLFFAQASATAACKADLQTQNLNKTNLLPAWGYCLIAWPTQREKENYALLTWQVAASWFLRNFRFTFQSIFCPNSPYSEKARSCTAAIRVASKFWQNIQAIAGEKWPATLLVQPVLKVYNFSRNYLEKLLYLYFKVVTAIKILARQALHRL